jgi:hypothetical protein
MFWVRLHGVLADLRSDWLALFRSVEVDPSTFVPNPRSLLALAVTTFRCIEAIRLAFTEDELVYADYRRHTEGHPTQKSYDVRWSQRGGVVVDKKGMPSLGRELTVQELDTAVRRVLKAHSGEPAIAIAFAKRIRALLPPLVEAMRRLAGKP